MGLFNFMSEESSSATTNNIEFKTSGNAPAVYGSNNQVQVNNTSDRALDSVDNAVTGAFNFGGRALDTVDRSVYESLQMAAAATSQSIAAAGAAAQMAVNSNTTVSQDAMSLTDRAMGQVANTFADALGYTSHLSDLAMGNSSDLAASAINQVAQGYESAKSLELGKNNVDNRYLIAVGMAVVAIVAFKVWGKA